MTPDECIPGTPVTLLPWVGNDMERCIRPELFGVEAIIDRLSAYMFENNDYWLSAVVNLPNGKQAIYPLRYLAYRDTTRNVLSGYTNELRIELEEATKRSQELFEGAIENIHIMLADFPVDLIPKEWSYQSGHISGYFADRHISFSAKTTLLFVKNEGIFFNTSKELLEAVKQVIADHEFTLKHGAI